MKRKWLLAGCLILATPAFAGADGDRPPHYPLGAPNPNPYGIRSVDPDPPTTRERRLPGERWDFLDFDKKIGRELTAPNPNPYGIPPYRPGRRY